MRFINKLLIVLAVFVFLIVWAFIYAVIGAAQGVGEAPLDINPVLRGLVYGLAAGVGFFLLGWIGQATFKMLAGKD